MLEWKSSMLLDILQKFLSYLMVGFSHTWLHIIVKITNVEVCQVVDQAKIALTVVQKRPCKNEVLNLKV